MIEIESGEIVRGRKETLSCGFVGLLIALAYAESMPPVREALRAEGPTFATLALFAVFFLTALRIFIGNTLYLHDPQVVSLGKWLWLYDFGVIVLETVMLIFLAGVCSVEASRATNVDFIALLVALYVVDVLWVLSQKPLRGIGELYRRRAEGLRKVGREMGIGRIPWGWARQNSLLIAGVLAPRLIWPDWNFYSNVALAWLLVIHVVAFWYSVVGYDFHRLLEARDAC